MSTLVIAFASFAGFLIAYHTYGRWLARKIFQLDPTADVPSRVLCDNVDYVPTRRSIVFGHHFTSIAGTGPIVGPAIAVFWGWLPALLWVVFGSIFIGAVHDFGSLVVSLRSRGQTIGEVAGRLISRRTRLLFLLVLFFALTVVLAIFGLVIATIFKQYPESVLGVWVSLPLAIVAGIVGRRNPTALLPLSIFSLLAIYAAIWLGAYHLPITIDPAPLAESHPLRDYWNPVLIWTAILLVYCAIASVLPVWILLQPRDYINSHQLLVALVLLVSGLVVASLQGSADLFASAPGIVETDELPGDAPPIWPFLFITIACGAISGFHCLVSSGTSSKQLESEGDAQYVGYGSMLLEGALAVIVILACCAGVGMGQYTRTASIVDDNPALTYQLATSESGEAITGAAAWRTRYQAGGSWADFRLPQMVGAFVEGGANFLSALGIPLQLGIGILAVLVACFAATTLDSATRLQRYVIQELGDASRIRPLTNKYVATFVAVALGGAIAALRGPAGPGSGGLFLWPLFGATNQLLAGLAFMVIAFYLWRRGMPVWFIVAPMLLMIVLPAWALCWNLFDPSSPDGGWFWNFGDKTLLASVALVTLVLQAWMVVEAILVWPKVRGVVEESLPPLNSSTLTKMDGGRSC